MNIILTIIIIVFFLLCAIGGVMEIFGLGEEEEKDEKRKEEKMDRTIFIDNLNKFSKVVQDFGVDYSVMIGPPPEESKPKPIVHNCVNCNAPVHGNYCEYCGTEYR